MILGPDLTSPTGWRQHLEVDVFWPHLNKKLLLPITILFFKFCLQRKKNFSTGRRLRPYWKRRNAGIRKEGVCQNTPFKRACCWQTFAIFTWWLSQNLHILKGLKGRRPVLLDTLLMTFGVLRSSLCALLRAWQHLRKGSRGHQQVSLGGFRNCFCKRSFAILSGEIVRKRWRFVFCCSLKMWSFLKHGADIEPTLHKFPSRF